MIFCQLWQNIMATHDVLPLHVGIVMENIMGFLIRCQYCDEKYTAICSWACSWGCSHACSHLHTSTVMEQYTATCSWACSQTCSCLHKYK